jgi:hypothetical protein
LEIPGEKSNGMEIPGKKFPNIWVYLARLSGKCRSIRHWKFPEMQSGIFGRMESAPRLSFRAWHKQIPCNLVPRRETLGTRLIKLQAKVRKDRIL